MANITVKRVAPTYILELSEEEKNYIQGLLQNPQTDNPSDEHEATKSLREELYNALSTVCE